MVKQTRVLAVAVSIQVAVVAWLALMAFLTPTESSESNLLLSIGLVAIGTLLTLSAVTWWRADAFSAELRVLSVAIPCTALLGLCLAGWMPFDSGTSGLPTGLVALLSVALVLASARLGRVAAPSVLPDSERV